MKSTGVENLMVRLTPDEQRQRGVDLATARRKLGDLDAKKKRVAKDIQAQKELLDELTSCIANCQETRPVEVKYVPNLEADTMTTVRLDTGAVVTVRMLDGNERRELKEPLLALNGKTMATADDAGGPSQFLGATYLDEGDQVGVMRSLCDKGYEAVRRQVATDGSIDLQSFAMHALIVQETAAEAQHDLDAYAKVHDLKPWAEPVPAAAPNTTTPAPAEAPAAQEDK